MRVNIIIPCYNEQENLWLIRKTFLAELKLSGGVDVRLVLVENGSTDKSRNVMLGENFVHRNIEIVKVNVNQGYGHGIKKGINYCDADYYCWTHADLQTPLSDVMALVKLGCKNNKEVMAGKRVTYGAQKLQSLVFDKLSSLVMGCQAIDINGQPKFFHHTFKRFFTYEAAPSDFSLDLYFFKIFSMLNKDIERHPVKFLNRAFGDAKGGQGSLFKRFLLLIRMLNMASRLRNIEIVNH